MDTINLNDTNDHYQGENQKEIFPRNILTHYQETLDAITKMEGENWKNDQSREGKTMYSALKMLKSLPHDPSRNVLLDIFTVNGGDGWHRYYIYPDGSVSFCSLHVFEKSEDVDLAKKLGFKIVRTI